ncbi:MAG TPA: aminotransferase class III-fold pyridoxal phosphate-dependent enzyme, partial [Thermoanaerobaculia bacterium]|nr:aminotransferase class III-fold pyridoxal phosphate-dependent enzyme [Thermoanaerobaculia bacterium]
RLWDVDGNEYVDIAMGFGVHFFGHSPRFVVEAVEAQLQRGLQLGPQSDLAGDVAALIRELTGMERATFANSGTEAVMTAMRLARAVTGRKRIALFNGSYHGSFDGTQVRRVVRGGEAQPVPSAPGVPQGMVEDLLVLDYGSPEALEEIRRHGQELAAVLVEPVQSRRPDVQPREFLLELRRITEESGSVLIFDDVIQGFRSHPGGTQAVFGVRADLAVYGKVVGGGMPIGVLAGTPRVMDAIDGGFWSFGDDSYPRADKTFFAGTFCKHPLAMAAALAVLRHLRAEGPSLQQRLNDRTAALAAEFNAFFTAERFPVAVVHFGSLYRFQFTRDQDLSDLFFFHLLEHGIYTWEGRTCFLSTAHTEEDLRILVAAVRRSVAELRAGGFFPLEEPAAEGTAAHRLPLTAAQRGIWSLCQLDPAASGAFNESIVCRFEGSLDVAALRRALQRVVDRHEVLRVTFEPDGEHQVVHPRLVVEIPRVDLSDLPKEERAKVEARLAAGGQGAETFDLEQGPLLRVRLFRFEPHYHLLDLTVHHLVTDGWSLGLLLSEIRQLYVAEHQGIAAQLPVPTPFSWYVELQDQRAGGSDLEQTETYWLAQFAGEIPRLDLPADRARPPVKSYRGARLSRQLAGDSLMPALRTLCRDQRCTQFMLLLAAFEALLHHLAAADDLVVGITLAEQPSLGAQSLMGYCLNVLPLRVRAEGNLAFRELLAHTRHRLAEAQKHQAYDIARLVKKLGLRRDRSRSPVYGVAFNHERGEVWHAPGGLRVEQVSSPNVAAQLDLSWMTVEMGGELTV